MKLAHRLLLNHRLVRTGQRGAIAVEMALVLLILVPILIGLVDFGVVIREHQVLQNAAREGARFSSLPRNQLGSMNPTATEARIRQRIIDYCARENLVISSGVDITIDQNFPIAASGLTLRGSRITIRYQSPYLVAGIFGENATLTAESIFRNLY